MALYKLLFDSEYRQLFLKGSNDKLCLSENVLEHLKTIDKEQLVKTSNLIYQELVYGTHQTRGGLSRSYPEVLRQLEKEGINIDEIFYRFFASDEFFQYRKIPYSGQGISLYEAFYIYLSLEPFIRNREKISLTLTHEFMIAIFSILVANRHPSFIIKNSEVYYNGTAYYSIQYYPAWFLNNIKINQTDHDKVAYLYAATEKAFIKGVIRPLSIELLKLGSINRINEMTSTLIPTYSTENNNIKTIAKKIYDKGLIS